MDKQDLRDKRTNTQARVKKLIDKPLRGEIDIQLLVNGKFVRGHAELTRPGYTHVVNLHTRDLMPDNLNSIHDHVEIVIVQPSTKRI